MTEDHFVLEMKKLGAAFGGRDMTPYLDAYWKELQYVDEKEFTRAVSKAIASDDRFPRVPRLKELMGITGTASHAERGIEKFAFFLCSRCGFDFTIERDRLLASEKFKCMTCWLYKNLVMWYDTFYLKKKLDENPDDRVVTP